MPNKSFLEDMMTLATGALGNLAEARHGLKAQAAARAGSMARGLDLVGREEFDAAFAMLAKARNAQEDLSLRLSRVEARLGLAQTTAKTSAKASKKSVKTAKVNLPSVKTKKPRRS